MSSPDNRFRPALRTRQEELIIYDASGGKHPIRFTAAIDRNEFAEALVLSLGLLNEKHVAKSNAIRQSVSSRLDRAAIHP
jgi:hypothetical protein